MKKIAPIILSMSFVLSGCWSSKELSEIAIVTALGIDKAEAGYRVSIQVVNPGAIAAKTGGQDLGMSVYTAEGHTILEAVRKLTTVAPRKPYFAHLRVVIFGEEIAKAGLRKPLDFLSRDHSMRTDFVITIAKGMKAEDQLKVLTPMEKVSANKIFSSIETAEENWSPTKIVLLDELISSLVSDGKEPVITGLGIIGDPQKGNKKENLETVQAPVSIKTEQIGVLKEDKFVGWLDESESKGFNYITDNITSTVGYIECDDGTVTLETIRSKTDMKGSFEKDKPKIKIHVSTESDIADVECPIEISNIKTIKKLEKQFNQKTEAIIMSSIEKAKELKSDIFGFGEALSRADAKKWEKIKDNWDEEFTNLNVEVTIDVKIRRTGTITESFQEVE
ncbi:Ger(x)C family spore germination protein [Bacillus tuaregi]|uniref:Ger(x)C family spore germination protein n=1 Tax=Bacillus tuaregi TaxID=1816695 RepID=UPI0008F937E3|nr:Ger(x)C family spore germination protein [Bacillus tuaregi]